MSNGRKIGLAVLLTAALLLLHAGACLQPLSALRAAAYETGAYITGAAMNLRVSPSTDSKVLDVIPEGTTVAVEETDGDWGRVTYREQTGWIHLGYSVYQPEGRKKPDQCRLVTDFSNWHPDGTVNWDALRAEGVDGVILRVGGRGYGRAKTLYQDDSYAAHVKKAAAAGMYVGAYFYSYALSTEAAVEEADFAVSLIRAAGVEPTLPVFIDMEDADGDYQHERAGKRVCSAVCRAFCDRIREAGYYPGIYTGKWFAEELIDPAVFENCAVWIAHYNVKECGYKDAPIDMWQYTESARLNGALWRTDLSVCYTDLVSLVAGLKTPAPVTEPVTDDPEPVTDDTEPVTEPLPEPTEEQTDYGTHRPTDEWHTVRAATCTNEGCRELKCRDCGVTLRRETTPRAAHTPEETLLLPQGVSYAPGEQLDGGRIRELTPAGAEDTGCVITVCGLCRRVLSTQWRGGSCPHTNTVQKTSPATCQKEGTVRTECVDCGATVQLEALPTCAHTLGAPETETENCAAGGTETVCCTVCLGEISRRLLPPAEHRFAEPETEVVPTLTRAGSARRTCTVCGFTETVDLPPLKRGDADANGTVSAADARLALRYSVGLEEALPAFDAADANGDGEILADDARIILRIAVGAEDPERFENTV